MHTPIPHAIVARIVKTIHRIISGDSRELYPVAGKSVHFIIPPYWQLKDYGTYARIGYHESYENYISN